MIEKLKSAMEVIKRRRVIISKVSFLGKSKSDCLCCYSINGHTETGIKTYKFKK